MKLLFILQFLYLSSYTHTTFDFNFFLKKSTTNTTNFEKKFIILLTSLVKQVINNSEFKNYF